MPAYIIAEINVHDEQTYEQYKALTPATIAAFNGEFVVRGGEVTSLEGDWQPQRIVVVKFESVQIAQEWWNSQAYSAAKAIRQATASSKMIIVDGLL